MGIKVGTRYTLADKARRNKAIIAYKEANKSATLREIARVFNISHVRVAKILEGTHLKEK